MRFIPLCILVLSPIFTATSLAEQLSAHTEDEHFYYHWQDGYSNTYEISFQLSPQPDPLHDYTSYQQEKAENYIFEQLRSFAKLLSLKGIKLKFYRDNGLNKVEIVANTKAQLRRAKSLLLAEKQRLYEHYLNQHHYMQYINPAGERVIKPDHIKIAKLSKPALQPLADAFAAQLNSLTPREGIQLLLGFIQSIPYDSLQPIEHLSEQIPSQTWEPATEQQDRIRFLTPVNVLKRNRGDCDSKATLLAALLKLIYPELPVSLVFVPSHALLAVALPSYHTELTINVDNEDYIMLEPTGPALLKMGQVGERTATHLKNETYTVEKWQ